MEITNLSRIRRLDKYVVRYRKVTIGKAEIQHEALGIMSLRS